MVLKDATTPMPQAHERNSILKCEIDVVLDPRNKKHISNGICSSTGSQQIRFIVICTTEEHLKKQKTHTKTKTKQQQQTTKTRRI